MVNSEVCVTVLVDICLKPHIVETSITKRLTRTLSPRQRSPGDIKFIKRQAEQGLCFAHSVCPTDTTRGRPSQHRTPRRNMISALGLHSASQLQTVRKWKDVKLEHLRVAAAAKSHSPGVEIGAVTTRS